MLLVLILVTAAAAAAQGRAFSAPVVPWESLVLTTPLMPAMVSVSLTPLFVSPMPELESTSSSELARMRTRWAVAWLAAVSLGWSLLVIGGNLVATAERESASFAPPTGGRNAMFFLSLGLASAVLLGADLGWVFPTVVVTILVFFGRDIDQRPRHWAILLRETVSWSDWMITASVAGIAILGYRRHDTTGWLRRHFEVST